MIDPLSSKNPAFFFKETVSDKFTKNPKLLSEDVCLEMLKNAPKRRARFRRRKS